MKLIVMGTLRRALASRTNWQVKRIAQAIEERLRPPTSVPGNPDN